MGKFFVVCVKKDLWLIDSLLGPYGRSCLILYDFPPSDLRGMRCHTLLLKHKIDSKAIQRSCATLSISACRSPC